MQGKKIQKEQPNLSAEKNLMVMKFGYSNDLVMSMDAAVTILKALEEAYEYVESYSDDSKIKPISNTITTKLISAEDYKKAKLNYILGVDIDVTNP